MESPHSLLPRDEALERPPSVASNEFRLSPEQQAAWRLVCPSQKTRKSALIVGGPGVGKSQWLRLLQATAIKAGVRPIVMAYMWSAALPVGGVTIHNVFKLTPEWSNTPIETLAKKFKSFVNRSTNSAFHFTDKIMLIFEEVSLIPVALLLAVDKMLRAATGVDCAFGDIQCVFIGDFHQLTPIFSSGLYGDSTRRFLSSYIFKANVLWRAVTDVVLFKTRFRSKDAELDFVLDTIESGALATDDDLLQNVVNLLKPCVNATSDARPSLQITGTNKHVRELNTQAEAEFIKSTVPVPFATILLGTWDGLESQAAHLHKELRNSMRLETDNRMRVGQTVKINITLSPELPKGKMGVITKIVPASCRTSQEGATELCKAGEDAYEAAEMKGLPTIPAGLYKSMPVITVSFDDSTPPVDIPYVVVTARLDLTHTCDGRPLGVLTGDTSVPYAGLVCCPLVASTADTAQQVQGMTLSKLTVHLEKLWGSMLPMLIGRVRRLSDLVILSHRNVNDISLAVWRALLTLHPDAQAFYAQICKTGPMSICKATVDTVTPLSEAGGMWISMRRASGPEPSFTHQETKKKPSKSKKKFMKRKRGRADDDITLS